MRVEKPDEIFELGVWMGKWQMRAALTGGRLAADAECLRYAHDRKAYRALGLRWKEFCKQRFGITTPTANRMIRRLKDFGPQGFRPKQATGITEEEYLRIAGAVRGRAWLRRLWPCLSTPTMAVPDGDGQRGSVRSDRQKAALQKPVAEPQQSDSHDQFGW